VKGDNDVGATLVVAPSPHVVRNRATTRVAPTAGNPSDWLTQATRQGVALVNPVDYLISGFRRNFPGIEAAIFLAIRLAVVWWIFKTGYRLKR
jgi:hypothetical protein